MHIDTARLVSSSGRFSYRHLLRTSYREGGKVKHKTLMALSGWTE